MSKELRGSCAAPTANEIRLDARVGNLENVMSLLDAQLEKQECPRRAKMALELAAEEVFVNIAMYAYAPGTGEVTIRVCPDGGEQEGASAHAQNRRVVITFMDQGVPYDPLAKEDPDVTLPASQRRIGGLGVYLVKQNVDDISYEYRDGSNVLTLVKEYPVR